LGRAGTVLVVRRSFVKVYFIQCPYRELRGWIYHPDKRALAVGAPARACLPPPARPLGTPAVGATTIELRPPWADCP
jgi:hypothetical protein